MISSQGIRLPLPGDPGLGANLLMFGKGFEPYINIEQRSGKWQKAGEDKEEEKSEMFVRLGALAYF